MARAQAKLKQLWDQGRDDLFKKRLSTEQQQALEKELTLLVGLMKRLNRLMPERSLWRSSHLRIEDVLPSRSWGLRLAREMARTAIQPTAPVEPRVVDVDAQGRVYIYGSFLHGMSNSAVIRPLNSTLAFVTYLGDERSLDLGTVEKLLRRRGSDWAHAAEEHRSGWRSVTTILADATAQFGVAGHFVHSRHNGAELRLIFNERLGLQTEPLLALHDNTTGTRQIDLSSGDIQHFFRRSAEFKLLRRAGEQRRSPLTRADVHALLEAARRRPASWQSLSAGSVLLQLRQARLVQPVTRRPMPPPRLLR